MTEPFDYGDFAVLLTTPFTVKANGEFISRTTLIILGIIGSILVYLSLIFRNGKGFRGNRYYAFFIVTCNLLYLIGIITYEECFPFRNMMIGHIRRIFLDYHPFILEWFNICYCWLSVFLFFETIFRSRLNISGFPHVFWIFYCLIITILTGVYIALRQSVLKFVPISVEPYSIFHLIGFVLLIITFIFLIISAIFMFCRPVVHGSYSGRAFLGVFIYGLITVWWQFPATYLIGAHLMPSEVNYTNVVEKVIEASSLVTVFTTTKEYAMLSLSAVSTWLMLLIMPGVSLFGFGNRKIVSSRIGDSGEKVLTAA